MAGEPSTAGIGKHGAERLPSVDIDSYAIELKDENGFLGDRASKSAFSAILEGWRRPLRKAGDDPFGNRSSVQINRKELDQILCRRRRGGSGRGARHRRGVRAGARPCHAALPEDQSLEGYRGDHRRRRLSLEPHWRNRHRPRRHDPEDRWEKLDLRPIRHHTDEAGLIGCLHLAPTWAFEAYDAILAVDIGGTNMRCGIVEPRLAKEADLSKARVWHALLWRHADEGTTREGAVRKLVKMLKELIGDAEAEGFKLAPFIGVACPGVINADGSIEKGAQNLPGNWESSKFNLPAALVEAIPAIGDHDTTVLMHNDGVAQGLSEVPFMQEFRRWGVLTIGTGLGNARFTNRKAKDKAKDEDEEA